MLEVFHLHIGYHSVVLNLLCALWFIQLTCAGVFHLHKGIIVPSSIYSVLYGPLNCPVLEMFRLHIGYHSVVLYLLCALWFIQLTCAGVFYI